MITDQFRRSVFGSAERRRNYATLIARYLGTGTSSTKLPMMGFKQAARNAEIITIMTPVVVAGNTIGPRGEIIVFYYANHPAGTPPLTKEVP